MKLVFENLSHRLVKLLADIFPESSHVRLLGFETYKDQDIRTYAGENGFSIVTFDVDFEELTTLYGTPPKIILLRCGNQSTNFIEQLLRNNHRLIEQFYSDTEADCLEIGK